MAAGILDRRIFFIINPEAGSGRARSAWEALLPKITELVPDFFWAYSQFAGSITQQVREAVRDNGARAVIVLGGDGSLNDALNGLVEDDRLIREDVVLGFHSIGSGCDFARTVHQKKKPSLLTLLQSGQVRQIDIGCCDYSTKQETVQRAYYINSFDAGAGADSCLAVNAEGGRIKRMFRNGKIAFLVTALKVLCTFHYTATVVETAERTYQGHYIIIGVGNGRFCGGGMQLYPQAKLDDGLLDLLLVEKRSLPAILYAFTKIYSGKFVREKNIHYLQTKQVRIAAMSPLVIEIDGEVPGTTRADIFVLPKLLPLLVQADENPAL